MKWGTAFGPEYVINLHDGLCRNSGTPFQFLCFTDDSEALEAAGIECRLLERMELYGWWHKPWLFSDEAWLEGPVVYFDLDTVITGNVDEVLNWRGEFIVAANPASRAKNPGARNIGAMLMGWEGGFQYGRETWQRVLDGGPALYGNQAHTGDQKLMTENPPERGFKYWQDECPNTRVVSYKADIRANDPAMLPEDVSIVCFHGHPRPHEAADLPWMQEHWREGV